MIEYKGYFYETLDGNGYNIYDNNKSLIIKQPYPYNRFYDPEGDDETNAKAQIDSIVGVPDPLPTPEEQLRADVDFIAVMTDLILPSQEEEKGE